MKIEKGINMKTKIILQQAIVNTTLNHDNSANQELLEMYQKRFGDDHFMRIPFKMVHEGLVTECVECKGYHEEFHCVQNDEWKFCDCCGEHYLTRDRSCSNCDEDARILHEHGVTFKGRV